MKLISPFFTGLAALAASALLTSNATAQGNTFTYQGRLLDGGAAANGIYDFTFTLFGASSGGSAIAGPLPANAVPISNGLFTVTLNFGAGVFTGPARWLAIGVKSNGVAGAPTTLAQRQALTPSPYAIFAGGAQTANSVAAGGVGAIQAGAVGSGAIADGAIQASDLNPTLLSNTFWRLTGNVGPGNLLGSSDNQPVELRVNNQPALRLQPNAASPNLIGGYPANTAVPGVAGGFADRLTG